MNVFKVALLNMLFIKVWTDRQNTITTCVDRQTEYNNYRVRLRVLKAIFNNISIISWWSVLLVKISRVLGENDQPVSSQ